MPVFSLARVDLDLPSLDPASALEAWLEADGSGRGFLLEKPEEERVCFAAGPFETLRLGGGKAILKRGRKSGALPGDPFRAAGRWLAGLRAKGSAPAFSHGAAGWLGYELVRFLEPRIAARKDLGEEGVLMAFPAMAVVGPKGAVSLYFLQSKRQGTRPSPASLARARFLETLWRHLGPARVPRPPRSAGTAAATMGRPAFLSGVRKIKEHIRAGDIFQCVLSEKFSVPSSEPPMDLFRRLRAVSPSPYSFYLADGARHYLGASPEMLVRVEGGRAQTCPIAGTRPRGRTGRRDRGFERALLRSPKERAEHLMLVDLGRNDLGRVCEPGSVGVASFMKVERFSHVMHLVSTVEGRLERGHSAWDALAACFPAGTVSGAPKVRAMEIIAALEPSPRGFYSGAFLVHDFQGNLDSCIAIRSVERSNGRAVFQAGAGIVADSRPESEYQEVRNKLAAARRALGAA